MSFFPGKDPAPGDKFACEAIRQLIVPRSADLGDGFMVRRALPSTQTRMVGPFVFFGALMASVKSLTLRDDTAGGQRCRFLACMGLPVLGLFCLMTLKSKVQANWPAGAWVTMTILWAGWLTAFAGTRFLTAFDKTQDLADGERIRGAGQQIAAFRPTP